MFKGRPREPRPPALPPETRTVGQLVAESLQLYRILERNSRITSEVKRGEFHHGSLSPKAK